MTHPMAERLLAQATYHDGSWSYATSMLLREAAAELDRLHERNKELDRQITGYQAECTDIEQELGKALGYPWYKDDQKNFPGATEAEGVCVGEHVPSSIAREAATRIRALETAEAEMRERAKELCTSYRLGYLQVEFQPASESEDRADLQKTAAYNRSEACRELAEAIRALPLRGG